LNSSTTDQQNGGQGTVAKYVIERKCPLELISVGLDRIRPSDFERNTLLKNDTDEVQGPPITVIVGATSKWRADGNNTILVNGHTLPEGDLPAGARWGLGGALALKFATEGHCVVLTSRSPQSLGGLREAVGEAGGRCLTVELDLSSERSIAVAFNAIRETAGFPEVLIYNAGYMAGRELPAEKELMEHFPSALFDDAMVAASRGPFLVAKEVLPAMRANQSGCIFFSNNEYSLRGRKRSTGQSLYYPRTMMRALAQALTEEYSEFGVHVANVVIDGIIDSPGTRSLQRVRERPNLLIDPVHIAEAYFYLYSQDPSCWSHELQLTPAAARPSF
jgi:NAD(P)-dependent dehydrogenase (short-subunit alcohol dehydrogenase family)